MKLNPFLTFDGACAEAMTFYQSVLGGTLTIMRYGDMPGDEEVPAEIADKVAHAALDLGAVQLQGSDMMQTADGAGYAGFDLQLEPEDAQAGQVLFDALAQGGEIIEPYAETFWAKGFGRCRDRFGMPWMVNCQ